MRHGVRKQGRTFFFVILAALLFLFLIFLVMRPRGSQSGPPADTTHHT
jgi:hypothetical protein